MLRRSLASSSRLTAPAPRRALSYASVYRSQSDGLFPQSEIKDTIGDAVASQEDVASTPLSPFGRRRMPALKSMAVPDSVKEVAAPEAAAPPKEATGPSAEAPAKASAVLASILSGSTTLAPAGNASATSSALLPSSAPYMPSTSNPAYRRHVSIFQAPPTPPPTHTVIVRLRVSRNNVIASLAYAHDGVRIDGGRPITGGTVGFKKAAQGGFECGHQVAIAVLRTLREENGVRLREKRDFKKHFYRAKAEERRLELVKDFEDLKRQQQLLAEEKRLLDLGIEAPAAPTPTTDAAASPATPAAIDAPKQGASAIDAPKSSDVSSMFAASTPLAVASSTDVADGTSPSTALAKPEKDPRTLLQRRAALAHSQKALQEALAAYNASVRLLSVELRDLQANRIPTDALLPSTPIAADIVQDTISDELREAEEQSAGQVGIHFKVLIEGFGQGREAFTAALTGREGHFVRPLCTGFGDASQMKRGGLRPRKARRI